MIVIISMKAEAKLQVSELLPHFSNKLVLCQYLYPLSSSILVWNELKNEFNVCRQYSTQEPCSCLHFTKASLIVGAEKFYEIDLKTFDIEEFLDESDTSLAYAIYGSTQMSSYPVAILQVWCYCHVLIYGQNYQATLCFVCCVPF